jgi:autotransporter-associated beta strand protein
MKIRPMKNRNTMTQTAIACHIPTILALSATLCGHAFSQTASIASGNWSSTSTWNTNAVPTANPTYVTANSTVTFQEGDSFTGSYGWLDGQFGVASGPDLLVTPGTGTLNITGGTLTTGAFWTGHGNTATINQSGGTLNIGGQHMLFGWNYGSTLNVSGGTMNMTGSGSLFNFGHTAESALNVSGTGVANLSGGISLQSGSKFNVNGGTLNLNNATVSVANGSLFLVKGGGSLNLLAGTQTINTNEAVWLGADGSTGTLNISGGTWQQNTYMRFGVFANGNGIINQTGGTFEIANDLEAWGSSPSAYNLQGGTFRTTANGVQINSYSGGSMTFNITGSSGNVTMDTPYDFTAPNTSVFNNAAATLTKTGAGKLTVAGALNVRNGALNMQAGTLETSSSITVGSSDGTATGSMSAGTLKTGYLGSSNFIVGHYGTGSFTQSNGTVDVGSQANSVIGWGATGTYTLSGGNYTAANNITFIGLSSGTGTVNVNGGSFSASQLEVGGNGATAGTLNLNGGTFGVSGAFNVGSGGTVNVNSGGTMSGGTNGAVTVNSGGLVNFNGGSGNASMNLLVNGGAVDVKGQTLAANTWANLVASGSGAVLKNSSATAASIGSGANAIWIWDGAGNLTVDTSGNNLQIDSRITSSGQTTATGLIKTGNNTLVLAGTNDYTGTTAINTGRIQVSSGSALGSTSGGTIVASGAQLLLNNVTVGNEALTISGTGLASGSSIAGALRTSGNSTYQGKVTLGADARIFSGSGTSLTLDVASGDAIDLASYTLTVDGAGTHTVSDAIVGTGGLTKIGSGTTTLSGTNTYTGLTTVSAGTLAVNGSVAGAMSVVSGATLQGSGTIGGNTTVSGNLKPGNSPGLLTFANSLTLDSTSTTTTMEITGIGDRGVAYDAVNVTNALTYGGTLILDFSGVLYTEGVYSFDLFDFGSSNPSSSFSSMSLAGIYGGSFTDNEGIWDLTDGDNNWSFNQADGILTFTVVPEPNVAMVAGSLALMAMLRRRRD